MATFDPELSLTRLLDPEVLANPYPLYARLREEAPVYFDPFLHTWVVTRYADVLKVLLTFSADRTPSPEQLSAMGMSAIGPIAQVMVKQMLFLDPPAHTRLRSLAATVFSPRRVKVLEEHIRAIAQDLIDKVLAKGRMDVMSDIAEPLPAIVTAELLGVPVEDHDQLKDWSKDFAEMLGNYQHNPNRIPKVLKSTEGMLKYFRERIAEQKESPREGLIQSLLSAEIDGDRLTDEEIIANTIVTMVGGQETTTNLIGNGLLTLLRNPTEKARLMADYSLIPSAIEELLRYESPSQQTGRIAREDVTIGGQEIKKGQAIIAVMASGNRDAERFPEPDKLDLARTDNRHLAFGWASHFCFGAPLARLEGQIMLETMLRRLPQLELVSTDLTWRDNLGLRGLNALPVTFSSEPAKQPAELSAV
jgi:pimeloyl-[acyl-carrier protein] synthase